MKGFWVESFWIESFWMESFWMVNYLMESFWMVNYLMESFWMESFWMESFYMYVCIKKGEKMAFKKWWKKYQNGIILKQIEAKMEGIWINFWTFFTSGWNFLIHNSIFDNIFTENQENVYTYMYIHIHTYTYIHIYIHSYVHTYIYTCIHTYLLLVPTSISESTSVPNLNER